MMERLIDADALKYEPLPKGERNYRTYNLDDAYEDGYNDAFVDVRNAPTIDAIPISFIEEQVKLCKEIGFRRGEECYMALIEKWREKNGTETN